MDEPAHSKARDGAATILVVVGALFLVGHATALFPYGQRSDWVSAAAFVTLVLAYATLTGPGRRSGIGAFLIGGVAVVPLFILWFVMMLSISERSWYYLAFNHFQVGLSGRGWGHAGMIWLVIWSSSIVSMVALAVAIRKLIVRSG